MSGTAMPAMTDATSEWIGLIDTITCGDAVLAFGDNVIDKQSSKADKDATAFDMEDSQVML
jgi:hypothetical protein